MRPDSESRIANVAPLRWLAAVICVVYGFAKLNGSQFTVLDSELARPMGEVSGFWLTWHFFGYSPAYGTFVALFQVCGGLLLVWPRTSVLAALLLLPVFGNIVLIDIFYGVDPGATVVALVALVCLVAVVSPHVDRLWAVIALESPPRRRRLRIAAMVLLLVSAWVLTWWVANYNNRHPTPIDGVWSAATSQTGAGTGAPQWQRAFFERNRAHLLVLRAGDGTEARHHFEIDAQGIVRVWETWLTKGALIMEGSLNAEGQLVLQGSGVNTGERLVLRRQSPGIR